MLEASGNKVEEKETIEMEEEEEGNIKPCDMERSQSEGCVSLKSADYDWDRVMHACSENTIKYCPRLNSLATENKNGGQSHIATVSVYCFDQMLTSQHWPGGKTPIKCMNQLDEFLSLVARCEIVLHNEENTRLAQIDEFNKTLSEKDLAQLWSDDYKMIGLKTTSKQVAQQRLKKDIPVQTTATQQPRKIRKSGHSKCDEHDPFNCDNNNNNLSQPNTKRNKTKKK
ncbi:hypothetical protein RFI_16486 [Reticulomyxa filosa]|uniref:Uncharacterized protein n=1 Tax=Reticulomyxa filosa TaxID=46433 RepID=X6N5Z3_RETFI|nr:hypothetical protein RFI_16486 [Reticulomyxa filosa]|eukprot:ETO20732.1 hypothetical protein RFI_16486 [Reticulomyxa filosa]